MVMLLAILTGCGKKPDATVDAFCKALQNSDDATISTLTVDGKDVNDNESDEVNEFEEYIKELNKDIKYEIVDSSVDGDNAEVIVKFTYSDAREVIGEVITEYISKAFEVAFSGEADETDSDKVLQEILNDKKKTVELGEAKQTITFKCVKKDGNWLISDIPDEMLDVASGNLATALADIGNTMDDTSGSTEVTASDELAAGVQIEVAPNEEIELATIKMTVTGCTETKTLDGLFDEKIEAQEGTKFVVFEVKVENIGKEAFEFASTDIPLLDSQERYFNQDTDVTFDTTGYIAWRELNPNIPETGTIIYKVPEDAADYKMVVGKGDTNEYYLFNGK